MFFYTPDQSKVTLCDTKKIFEPMNGIRNIEACFFKADRHSFPDYIEYNGNECQYVKKFKIILSFFSKL